MSQRLDNSVGIVETKVLQSAELAQLLQMGEMSKTSKYRLTGMALSIGGNSKAASRSTLAISGKQVTR